MKNSKNITPKGSFGAMLKQLRMAAQLTLREACKQTGYDPSNWSKIERGILSAPKESVVLESWLKILKVKKTSSVAKQFFELAELSQGRIPSEVLDDARLVELLPAFFRTVRGKKPDKEEILRVINLIKKHYDG